MTIQHYCPKCGRQLIESNIKGYTFHCLECDEDFYRFEVTTIKTDKNMTTQSFRPNEVKLIYPPVKQTEQIRLVGPFQAFEFALQFYDEETIQHHITTKVILLSGNCMVLGVITISESAHTYDIVETKFILQAAILANAKSIIVVSNNPSGDLKPSDAEKELKMQVKAAAYLFDIELADYLLISSEDYYSFADNKIL